MFLDGLYSVTKASEIEATVLLSGADHPVFKAHFPSNPILPGFAHIEIIEDIFSLDITTVKKAKFSAVVSPNTELHYIREGRKFKVLQKEELVATFSF